MTIYRVSEPMTVYVEALGRDVQLHPGKELDDRFPEHAAVIKEWAGRGVIAAPNVEAATAAPGEARSARRPKKDPA